MSRDSVAGTQRNAHRPLRALFSKARGNGIEWAAAKLRAYIVFWGPSLLLLPFAALLRMVLLGLRPLIHIRFGKLPSSRLGTLAQSPELYLCEREAGTQPSRSLDLWYHHNRDGFTLKKRQKQHEAICNQQLASMWERVIHVTEVARHLDHLNQMFPPGRPTFTIEDRYRGGHDLNGLFSRFPAHLSFTESEEERGREELQKMGIGPDDSFVCFHARDSAYLDVARPRNVEVYGDWSWQDPRDATIDNYLPAAEKLTELGYVAIRMGKYVKEPLACSNPRIIDYATQHQSDFLDVYLSARCSFFIGQSSGMTALPMLFRKPMVFVNVFPLWDVGYCQYSGGIMAPKKYHSEKWGRCLTFREVFEMGLGLTNITNPEHQQLFDSLGITMLESAPEEISEAALEMHQRLTGSFSPSDEDRRLQDQFLAVMNSHPDGIPPGSPAPNPIAAAHFLRTNQALLA